MRSRAACAVSAQRVSYPAIADDRPRWRR
jgi:hypothetical protein